MQDRTINDTNCSNYSSVEIEARGPRFQIGVLVAPGATTFTRLLRGARSAARAIETTRLVCGHAGLAEIVVDCAIKDDAAVVVQQ